MRRLYSSFARGAPGAGLLLMRLAAGGYLVATAIVAFVTGATFVAMTVGLAALTSGLLLALGLWTPIAGLLAAATSAWRATSGSPEPSVDVLLSVVGVALALLGPGAWSLDARLFGWKRLEIRNGRTHTTAPSAADPPDEPRL